jgi:K+-transporting ATPase ATPase C chain
MKELRPALSIFAVLPVVTGLVYPLVVTAISQLVFPSQANGSLIDPGNDRPIPVDLVTASGSGLDPNISPAAAAYQIARVARVRRLSDPTVRALVDKHTRGRQLGVLGEPVVDVLALNLALDRLEGK